MRTRFAKLLCALLAIIANSLGCRAQHAENILRGRAARDYLLSAAVSGDVGVQAAVAEADSDLIAKLAVDEDLAYDVRENKFLYACAALAVPDDVLEDGVDTQTAIDIAEDTLYSSFAAANDAVSPTSYTGPDAVDPVPSLDTVFRLHSRPESVRKVYLDFNGHTTSGTAWNSNGRAITTPPYSMDDSPDFSYVELQAIISIWRAVAEDYSIFDVDITTEEPPEILGQQGSALVLRAVIGGSAADWFGAGAGGVAYIGAFGRPRLNPAFIFPAQLRKGAPKFVWEATSHEVGHAMGLNHDGDSSTAYYGGQGRWAPIMGVGYYRPITQWSKGEYANANNKEDDIAIICSTLGNSFAPQDGGSSFATAVPLARNPRLSTADTVTATAAGILDSATPADYFSFVATAAGEVEVRVDVMPPLGAEGRANLDVTLSVTRVSTGEVLVTGAKGMPSDPLGAHVNFPDSPAGEHVISVQPQGREDPWSSGYSSYGSGGQYYIVVRYPNEGTVLAGWSPPPPSPPPPSPPPPSPLPPSPPPPAPPPDLPSPPPPVPDSNEGNEDPMQPPLSVETPSPPPPSPPPPFPPPAPRTAATGTLARTEAVRLTSMRVQRWAWASAYVRVVTNLGRPVRGAKVIISWQSPTLQQQGWPYTSTATTGSTGVAYMYSKAVAAGTPLADVTFSVVGVVAPGLRWDGQVRGSGMMRVGGSGSSSSRGKQQQQQQQQGGLSPPSRPGVDDYYTAPLLLP